MVNRARCYRLLTNQDLKCLVSVCIEQLFQSFVFYTFIGMSCISCQTKKKNKCRNRVSCDFAVYI